MEALGEKRKFRRGSEEKEGGKGNKDSYRKNGRE